MKKKASNNKIKSKAIHNGMSIEFYEDEQDTLCMEILSYNNKKNFFGRDIHIIDNLIFAGNLFHCNLLTWPEKEWLNKLCKEFNFLVEREQERIGNEKEK
jgi:hypothetical protein